MANLRAQSGQGNGRDNGGKVDGDSQAQGKVGQLRPEDGGAAGGGAGTGGGEGSAPEFEEDAFGMKDEYGDLRNIFAAQVSETDDLNPTGGRYPIGHLRVRPLKG